MNRRLVVFAAIALSACGRENDVKPVLDAGSTPLPTSVCLDNDGDGFSGTGDCTAEAVIDCNDRDSSVFPGALEVCNGVDDSCNGQIDEGLPVVSYYRDEDADGVGSMKTG